MSIAQKCIANGSVSKAENHIMAAGEGVSYGSHLLHG